MGAGLDSSSLDLIFDPTEQVTAVGLTPLVNTGSSFADAPAVFEFRIYDPANTLISSGTASGNRSGTYFFGAVTTGGEIIGRINLFAPVGGIAVDNIQVFNGPVAQPVPIPEPSGVLLAWMSVVTLACSIRLRQRPTL